MPRTTLSAGDCDGSAAVRRGLSAVMCCFVLAEVNYPFLTPQTQLAAFALLGLLGVFLHTGASDGSLSRSRIGRLLCNAVPALATVFCFGYVVIQSEPAFSAFWSAGQALGDRAGAETAADIAVGAIGLLLVLEAARRTVGWALPLLAITFLLYGYLGRSMPDFMFPHRGYDLERLVGQTFLQSQGVFGIALRVMLTYVFLFVLFGAVLERTGAIGFIIDFTRRLLGDRRGGPAKIAVVASGLMGSLSGSAVANTATTGTFTIPLMRSAGFSRSVAGGIEAAASSGGALVPPIMGAGAYMMLEIVDPPVTYLQIIRAAVIPALLYYGSLLLIVHLYARRIGAGPVSDDDSPEISSSAAGGYLFALAFTLLIIFLVLGFTPFRAVTVSLLAVCLAGRVNRRTRLGSRDLLEAAESTIRSGLPLVAAACCVGIIVGVVTLTGVGARLPGALLPLAQNHLILALLLLMVSSLILGMGLPSSVCYLLLATLVGPALGALGPPPLAAHFFIFYFGMMSMVTPPVALAAYTASAIAGSRIMPTATAAFRFSLAGFALPYAFVLNPELLLLDEIDGAPLTLIFVIAQTVFALFPLAAGITGQAFAPIPMGQRLLLSASALSILILPHEPVTNGIQIAALTMIIAIGTLNYRAHRTAIQAEPLQRRA